MNNDILQTYVTSVNIDQRPEISLPDTESGDISKDVIISDRALEISQLIIFPIVCLTIDVCGTVANILNIICFVKQGFKDPVNISLLGLAVSDLGCLVPLIWTNICLTPALIYEDLPFEPVGFQSLTGTWPHITFTRVTAWMTALLALERCLCVTVPLKVKKMLTPRRVVVITSGVFVVLIASMTPMYIVNRLDMIYFPSKNKSIIGIVFMENKEATEKISFLINNVLVSFTAFIVIIVCTTILVIKLKSSTKWRSVTATEKQADNVTVRNQKVSRMVVMISSLFVACFIPIVMICVAMTIEPEISIVGKYKNMAFLLGGLGFVMESVNSSMNIFIYYHLSSKYRDTFRQLFCFGSVNRQVHDIDDN